METLASIIARSGLTHQEIATRAGLSVSLISKIATGKRNNPTVATYAKVLKACEPKPKRRTAQREAA